MKKLLLSATAMVALAFSVNAQDYTVSVQLQDINAKVIPYASVSLSTKADTTTLQFAIAREDGTFTMKKIEKGGNI